MIAVLGVHVAVAVLLGAVGRRLGRNAFLLAAVAPAVAAGWLVSVTPGILDGEPVTESVSWVPTLGLDLDLRLDAFGLLVAWLVAGIGVAVFTYARGYFGDRDDIGRMSATLVLFAGAMLGLVSSDNLLGLFVFWELTTVTSYLLIGIDDTNGAARSSALRALLITATGGLALLAGSIVLALEAGTFSLSEILAAPPEGTAVSVAVALMVVGAMTKSAQWPVSFWLPGAMAAPTPISAYLHSATMVKAGVYLLARLSPAFADLAWWQPVVVGLGLVTMLVGGWRALRQVDLKLLLAHGTVSQLGFMVVLLGSGEPELVFAGCAVLLAHGVFKAALFLTVGIVDHQAHTRDLRRLDGLGRRLPVVFAVAAVAGASMAGLPPLLGFLAKESAYEALVHAEGAYAIALVGVVLGSILTFAYTARYLWGGFAAKDPADVDDPVGADVPRPSAGFVAPAVVLAALTVVLGVVPALPTDLVGPAAGALIEEAGKKYLVLWHGFTLALLLTVVTIAAGVALFLARHRLARLQDRLPHPALSEAGYERSLVLMNRLADRVTGTLQNGSLPVYLAVILLTAVALPLPALLSDPTWPEVVTWDSPLQAVVVAVIVAAALATALAKRRFVAVVLVGTVGFGVAGLFVLQGAPDLALTQLLVETLSLVLFVLVLRHLPDRFQERTAPGSQALRAGVAAAVGAFVFVFALVAAGARQDVPISGEFLDRALPEADGANVVNVILVDFRGYDTLGEITVLAVAALGVASLVLAGRGAAERADVDDPGEPLVPATGGDGDADAEAGDA